MWTENFWCVLLESIRFQIPPAKSERGLSHQPQS